LSQSELAYSKSDFTTAQNLAVQSSQSLANFVSEANGMRDAAAQQRSLDFYVKVVGSIAGAVVILIVGLAVWRLLNKRESQGGEQIDVITEL
jgi:ABC-type phosphonate transport system ATPase subunit